MAFIFPCPACGAGMNRITVLRGKAFRCPTCDEDLAVQFPFTRSIFWFSITLSPLLLYGIGFRGLALVLLSFVAWLPIGIVGRSFLNRVSPPKIVRHAEVTKAARSKRPSFREVIREQRKPNSLNLRDKKHNES